MTRHSNRLPLRFFAALAFVVGPAEMAAAEDWALLSDNVGLFLDEWGIFVGNADLETTVGEACRYRLDKRTRCFVEGLINVEADMDSIASQGGFAAIQVRFSSANYPDFKTVSAYEINCSEKLVRQQSAVNDLGMGRLIPVKFDAKWRNPLLVMDRFDVSIEASIMNLACDFSF